MLMTMGQQRDTYTGPMIDGQIVPEAVETAFRAGRQARIPYMIGANNREFGFMPLPPAAVEGMLARFGPAKDEAARRLRPAEDRRPGRGRRGARERRGDGGAGASSGATRRLRRAADLRLPLLLRGDVAARHGEGRAARDRDPVRVLDRAREVRRGDERGGRGHGRRWRTPTGPHSRAPATRTARAGRSGRPSPWLATS